jgi:hypothetical protein
MRNLLITLVLCGASLVYSNAQIVKPGEGDKLVELSASGLANLGSGLNQQYGGAMFRMFKSDMTAHRWAVDMGLSFIDARTDDQFLLDHIMVNWGMENHMTGSARMSTYWGYGAGLSASNNFDVFGLQAGLFTGFDYYIADGLYLGAELGYRLRVQFDPLEIVIPGSGLNASLKMGYRL